MNQPRPLMPSYLDEQQGREPQRQEDRVQESRGPEGRTREARTREVGPQETRREQERVESRRDWNEPKNAGRLEVETQPEIPSLSPAGTPGGQQAQLEPKGYVVLAIGLPGSGKTTWFRRRGVMPLSSDMLRGILFDDVEEQRFQGLVFSTLRSLLRARLIAKMPWNYVDATNLSVHERRQWIKMAKSFGYETQAVFFDVPLEVCLERNRSRDRMVAEEVMRKMAEKLKPPVFEEGFAKITVVRVKAAG